MLDASEESRRVTVWLLEHARGHGPVDERITRVYVRFLARVSELPAVGCLVIARALWLRATAAADKLAHPYRPWLTSAVASLATERDSSPETGRADMEEMLDQIERYRPAADDPLIPFVAALELVAERCPPDYRVRDALRHGRAIREILDLRPDHPLRPAMAWWIRRDCQRRVALMTERKDH